MAKRMRSWNKTKYEQYLKAGRYWQELGIDWRLVTEREIPVQKSRNIEWLYTSATLPEYLDDHRLQEGILCQIECGIPVSQL